MRYALPLLAALTLSGCVTRSYVATRMNVAPLNEALARCQYQANTSPATIVNGGLSGLTTRDVQDMCMNAEGYRVKIERNR